MFELLLHLVPGRRVFGHTLVGGFGALCSCETSHGGKLRCLRLTVVELELLRFDAVFGGMGVLTGGLVV